MVTQTRGETTGDDRMETEGLLDEAKGKGKHLDGDLKDAAAALQDDAKRATRCPAPPRCRVPGMFPARDSRTFGRRPCALWPCTPAFGMPRARAIWGRGAASSSLPT
jgi:uncharacterized protein YjbJ (UPF0337 family)